MKFSQTIFVALVSYGLSTFAQSHVGRASWDALGTTPCPVACSPLTDFRVALPINLFPNGERCCEKVDIQYEGKSVTTTFTDRCLFCEGSFNISLSHQAFAVLAPLELGTISPVTWAFSN